MPASYSTSACNREGEAIASPATSINSAASVAGVDLLDPGSWSEYQKYVLGHPDSGYCHDIAWQRVISRAYAREPIYLVHRGTTADRINGVLPAFLLRSRLFGTTLVSLPYLDAGGILADSDQAEDRLLGRFHQEAARWRAASELRCTRRLRTLAEPHNEKVGMMLDLASLDEASYWKKLDPKARNQVRKAEKSQVTLRWGRQELLDDFYAVFARNMRDLGSPVHSRRLFTCLLDELAGAQVGAAYRAGRCIGGLIRIQWRDTLAIPWASTLKEERVHCPNNALYWESIRFAFREKCRRVDLGRSTRNEGTWRFKLQWLAAETALPWYQFNLRGDLVPEVKHTSSGRLAVVTALWARLPLRLANALGPRLRPLIPA